MEQIRAELDLLIIILLDATGQRQLRLGLDCTWQSSQYTQTFTSFGINYPFSPTSISSPPLNKCWSKYQLQWKTENFGLC